MTFPLRFVLAPILFVATGLAACSEAPVVEATHTAEIAVGGMTCTGCEGAIDSTVLALEGVETCDADFEKGLVLVTYKSPLTDEARITEVIRSIGYDIPPQPESPTDTAPAESK